MPPRKQRGAQPGNTNALRHGFYSPAMRAVEVADLKALLESADQLDDEIAMLRVVARRVAEENEKASTLDDVLATSNAFGMAVIRLSSLMRAQQFLSGSSTGASQAISSALSEVLKEMGLA